MTVAKLAVLNLAADALLQLLVASAAVFSDLRAALQLLARDLDDRLSADASCAYLRPCRTWVVTSYRNGELHTSGSTETSLQTSS